MRPFAPQHRQRAQAGGITIVVALMLLVLLTIAAVGMSRNAMRDVVTSGFARQGAMARNVADSGLEWSIHWIEMQNGAAAPSGGTAAKLTQLKAVLLDPRLREASLQGTNMAGRAWDVNSANVAAPSEYLPGGTPPAGLTLTPSGSTTQASTLGLTYMGKLAVALTSQGVGAGAYAPAAGGAGGAASPAPDLWAIRADAQVTQGSATFVHAKELWVSTPVR